MAVKTTQLKKKKTLNFIYIYIYKQVTNKDLPYDTGNSYSRVCNDLHGKRI